MLKCPICDSYVSQLDHHITSVSYKPSCKREEYICPKCNKTVIYQTFINPSFIGYMGEIVYSEIVSYVYDRHSKEYIKSKGFELCEGDYVLPYKPY